MNYKDIYYKQYQKKADELHQLILDEFKKAKDRMKNFEFAKKVILKKLADIEHKSLDDSEENIKLLLETYFLRTEYQRGSEDLVFKNELKEKYDELKEKLSFSNYNSFLKALANYDVTVEINSNFDSYWSNLRSMYRLSKYQGYDSFKKFDLIKLRKDGNQAISKELHEIENPEKYKTDLSKESLDLRTKYQNDIQKLDELKFKLKNVYRKIFESLEFYEVVTSNFIDKDTLNHQEFINLFVEGNILQKEVYFHCQTEVVAHFIYTIKNVFYKKLSIRYFLKHQSFISSDGDNITNSNLSTSKNKSLNIDFDMPHLQLAKYKL